jgi:hypothetical protein
MGSDPQLLPVPQPQLAAAPLRARVAASPYFCWTIVLISVMSLLLVFAHTNILSAWYIRQGECMENGR